MADGRAPQSSVEDIPIRAGVAGRQETNYGSASGATLSSAPPRMSPRAATYSLMSPREVDRKRSPRSPRPMSGRTYPLTKKYTTNLYHAERKAGSDDDAEKGPVDAMAYGIASLTEWRSFFVRTGTVWSSWKLWSMMLKLLLLALVVGIFVFLFAWDPNALKLQAFLNLSTYLNVFVAFLLGLFMHTSLNRWINCVNGFEKLFEAVRGLQMCLCALGVEHAHIARVVRYGVVSGRLLAFDLTRERLPEEDRSAAQRDIWETLQTSGHEEIATLMPDEVEMLMDMEDPASLLWIWVSSYVGRLSQDGHIPSMQSPTYCSIVALLLRAQDGIRNVRTSISVQTPFIYVHTLATVVHINNILAAVTFGMTLGASIGVIAMSMGVHLHKPTEAENRPIMIAVENLIISLILCFVGPLMFQAFLLISIAVSSPFSQELGAVKNEAMIPVDRMLQKLQRDLIDGATMARRPPGWEAPKFIHRPSSARESRSR